MLFKAFRLCYHNEGTWLYKSHSNSGKQNQRWISFVLPEPTLCFDLSQSKLLEGASGQLLLAKSNQADWTETLPIRSQKLLIKKRFIKRWSDQQSSQF